MAAKILVVDDEPSIVKLIATTLRARGHTVIEAMSGTLALELARSEKPDLILLDIMMPRMDGREVRKRLLADPATAAIPVIHLSAVGDFESQLADMEGGLTDYITKPFAPRDLADRVEEVLDPTKRDLTSKESDAKAGNLRTIVEIMHRERERWASAKATHSHAGAAPEPNWSAGIIEIRSSGTVRIAASVKRRR